MQKKEIRKILIIILIAIVYTVLLIAIMQNRNVSIIAKYEDMSKAMPESTEIADLQKQIERLQKENEDLLGEISKANATDDKVLSGEKVWSNGNIEEGTMANNGELNWNPETSTTYNVQAGYYSGGTLDSSSAYNKGKEDGISAPKTVTLKVVTGGTSGHWLSEKGRIY